MIQVAGFGSSGINAEYGENQKYSKKHHDREFRMNRQPEIRPPKRSERNNHLTGSANLALGPTIQKFLPPITWSLREQIPLTQEDPSPKVRKKCRKHKKKVKPSEPCLIQPSVSLLAHTESDDDPYIQKLQDIGWRVDEFFEFCQQTGQDLYAFLRKLKANDQIFLQLYQDSTAQEISTTT
eukprot:TRINITY_DN522_c0_g1_i7.p1 TRINITY_DN522_c0_g1~~TRINITY_DN522_c0_g1_i7.p1  ORF type:complete len:196 (-),score=29.01 TRINITY_DN522_c0_g1_i7:203-745(-)